MPWLSSAAAAPRAHRAPPCRARPRVLSSVLGHAPHWQRGNKVRRGREHCRAALQTCTSDLHFRFALQTCTSDFRAAIFSDFRAALQGCTSGLHFRLALQGCTSFRLALHSDLHFRLALQGIRIPRNTGARPTVARPLLGAAGASVSVVTRAKGREGMGSHCRVVATTCLK